MRRLAIALLLLATPCVASDAPFATSIRRMHEEGLLVRASRLVPKVYRWMTALGIFPGDRL